MEPGPKNNSAPASPSANADRVKMVVYTKRTDQPPVMSALVRQLESQKERLEYAVLNDPAQVFPSVQQTTMTVLILTLHAKEELVDVMNVLGQVQSRIQSGLLRAIVLNGMNHPRVIGLLKAKGAHEIVDFETNIKALNHKIKNSFLVVTQAFQRLKNQNVRAAAIVGAEAGRGRAPVKNDSTNEIRWVKSVEHVSDFWWLPSAKNLRNVMGRWLIDLLGPGPSAGVWEESPHERGGEKGWIWKPRVSTDRTFLPKNGRWIFFGRQPEFVWQKNLWSLVSKQPFLAFYPDGQSEAEFIRIDSPVPGRVTAFENSEVARAFLSKIQATLEASLKLSKAETPNEVRGNFDPSPGESTVTSSGFLPSSSGQPESAAPRNYSTTDGGGSSSPEWNNHAEAVGFDFKGKDVRVERAEAKAKWRNPLKTTEELAGKIGFQDVQQPGVSAGAKTFERMILVVRPAKRNGVEIVSPTPVRVIEMTERRFSVEFLQAVVVLKDKFSFNVEFRLGNVEKIFDLEWVAESVEPVEGAGSLVHGPFTGGALEDLALILKLVARRQLELKEFFNVAKGA